VGQYAAEEASQLTVEVHAADVLEQLFAPRVLHLGADPRVVGAEVLVHVVERVGHGVHSIDHELHLPLLLVVGVFANPLLSCTSNTHTQEDSKEKHVPDTKHKRVLSAQLKNCMFWSIR